VAEIIRSESALQEAARAGDLRVGQLRGNVSSQQVGATGAAARTAGAALVTIEVEGDAPRKAERAADALARTVIERTSAQYVDAKVETFEAQLDSIQDQLNSLAPRITAAEQAVEEPGLSPLDKLVVVGQLDNAQQRRGQLLEQQTTVQQQLALAENVERAQVINPAAASQVTARSARNSALVGALIGLLVGAVLALLAEPILARRNRAAGR
jgi:uncharacterized protein involved in exopolysaccharide biosynthesis